MLRRLRRDMQTAPVNNLLTWHHTVQGLFAEGPPINSRGFKLMCFACWGNVTKCGSQFLPCLFCSVLMLLIICIDQDLTMQLSNCSYALIRHLAVWVRYLDGGLSPFWFLNHITTCWHYIINHMQARYLHAWHIFLIWLNLPHCDTFSLTWSILYIWF